MSEDHSIKQQQLWYNAPMVPVLKYQMKLIAVVCDAASLTSELCTICTHLTADKRPFEQVIPASFTNSYLMGI